MNLRPAQGGGIFAGAVVGTTQSDSRRLIARSRFRTFNGEAALEAVP